MSSFKPETHRVEWHFAIAIAQPDGQSFKSVTQASEFIALRGNSFAQ
jgi:hypothetical protein